MNYTSWNNYFNCVPNAVLVPEWRDAIEFPHKTLLLAYGNGRSYGDSCLLNAGTLIFTHRLNRFIQFDTQNGILRCEAGITFADILTTITPAGWSLPVLPGTQQITLGGAIANDIHGKNHPRKGTFGQHVIQFELLRSNGERFICSREQHPELFAATIGGLGLTGLITWAEIQLSPIPGNFLQVETICFTHLDQFFELYEQSKSTHEYHVAWLDCQTSKQYAGRGIFMRGNYVPQTGNPRTVKPLRLPFYLPNVSLNKYTIKLFNELYYQNAKLKQGLSLQHYQTFFFPLDRIQHWNRMYGKRGFFQYQCVLPITARQELKALISMIAQSEQSSFLSVLKMFGEAASPGMLSFPKPGITLALDFPNQGAKTLALFEQLDVIVQAANGRLYPAKDARMSAAAFQSSYPNWLKFTDYIDPQFSSNFYQRIK